MPSICAPCTGKKRQADARPPPAKKTEANINGREGSIVPRLSKDLQKTFNTISPKIIIIGAGAAGMAAAQRLMESGFNNLMILEAQNYVGGRVCSQVMESGYIEKGAQFLHGENGLTFIVRENNLVKVTEEPRLDVHVAAKEHGVGGVFLIDDEAPLADQPKERLAQAFKETYQKVNEIVESCKDTATLAESLGNSQQTSFGQYLKNEFEKFMVPKDDEPPSIRAYRWAIYEWMIRVHLSDMACRSLFDLSVIEYSKYAGSLECTPLSVPMIDALRLCVPYVFSEKAPVMLSKPVQQVRFDSSAANPIMITCEDGQAFIADHCIVTASLGFLKKNHETFFNPALPADKAKAILETGYGTVNKVFLTFSEPFWITTCGGVGGFQLLYLNDAKGSQQRPWHRAIIGFDVCTSLPNTLVAWIGGSEPSEAMELLTDAEIATDCQTLLQKFLKTIIVPVPIKVMRSSWFGNKYTAGSYSNTTVNQSDNIGILAQPMWLFRRDYGVPALTDAPRKSADIPQFPALLFAGEATHPTWFSTVPGALESGRREADRLITLYAPLIAQLDAIHAERQSLTPAPLAEERKSIQSQQQQRVSGSQQGQLPRTSIQAGVAAQDRRSSQERTSQSQGQDPRKASQPQDVRKTSQPQQNPGFGPRQSGPPPA